MRSSPHTIYGNHDHVTMEQFFQAMREPYVVSGALMADGHAGYSLPIGAVVATEDTVVPAWVGYDIGCGVLALMTGWEKHQLVDGADCQQILLNILKSVPVGFNHNTTPVEWRVGNYLQNLKSQWLKEYTQTHPITTQLGTLGSGNHFIEIGADELDRVWIIVHSGSRNLGHTVAAHYMKLASGDGRAREGNYPLYGGTLHFSNYMSDQLFVQQFALENRMEIVRRVFRALLNTLGKGLADWHNLINRNHNHVEFDRDFRVYIHRKGATHAEEGMLGVIPGNMRDGSVIVRGKGNNLSLFSSSHGAGRAMSRSQAKKLISVEDLTQQMAGITCRITGGITDEGPEAYKQFDDVLGLQSDLIEVVHRIKPIINVKGGK